MQIQTECSLSKQDTSLAGDKVESLEETFHRVLEVRASLVEKMNIINKWAPSLVVPNTIRLV